MLIHRFFVYAFVMNVIFNAFAQSGAPPTLTEPRSNPKQKEQAQGTNYKGEFVLVRNEDPVCTNFTRNLNEFRRMDFDVCHARLSPKYPEFSRPQWQEVPLDLSVALKARAGAGGDGLSDLSEKKTSKQWLSETEVFRQKGEIKMWMTQVDINHDGEIESIARIDRAASGRDEPIANRNCSYTSSGLWMMAEPKVSLHGPDKHFYFGRKTDLIYLSNTNRTYAVAWTELAMSDNDYKYPSPKGATKGVSVGLARAARSPEPMEVCYIAWVPTGTSPKLESNQRQKRQP
jgi:hypothetical protein